MNSKNILMLALSASLLGGCGGGDSSGTGTVTLRLTDAPVDSATSVVVTFTGVELLRENAAPIRFGFDAPRQIDLLALQGGENVALLDGVSVPAGNYSQIRLEVNAEQSDSTSYITLDDGSEHPLFIPSGNQTGLKLSGITVAQGGNADFTVDFDLRKSVTHPPGLGGSYILKPTLRLVQTDVVGQIAGTVSNTLTTQANCSPAVYVYTGAGVSPDDVGSGTEPLASAQVALDDASGEYRYTVAFLEPGQYTAAFTCAAASDDPETDDDIAFEPAVDATVTTGETTTVNFGS